MTNLVPLSLLAAAFPFLALTVVAAEAPSAPVARKAPGGTTLHGETLTDPYAWLREKSNPEVRAYLEAENAYADAMTKPLARLRDTLYGEILGRIKETDPRVSNVLQTVRDGSELTQTHYLQLVSIYCNLHVMPMCWEKMRLRQAAWNC